MVHTLYDLYESLKVAEELDAAGGSSVQKSFLQQAEQDKNFWKRNTARFKRSKADICGYMKCNDLLW